jgi:hypothetical protein
MYAAAVAAIPTLPMAAREYMDMNSPRSCAGHTSAIEPPTIVAPVEPNAPFRKRPTMTVVMFGALCYLQYRNPLTRRRWTYNAIMRCVSANPAAETM